MKRVRSLSQMNTTIRTMREVPLATSTKKSRIMSSVTKMVRKTTILKSLRSHLTPRRPQGPKKNKPRKMPPLQPCSSLKVPKVRYPGTSLPTQTIPVRLKVSKPIICLIAMRPPCSLNRLTHCQRPNSTLLTTTSTPKLTIEHSRTLSNIPSNL